MPARRVPDKWLPIQKLISLADGTISFVTFFPSSELTSTGSPEVERDLGGGRGERREGGGTFH